LRISAKHQVSSPHVA